MPAARLALSHKHPCLWVIRTGKIKPRRQDARGTLALVPQASLLVGYKNWKN